MALRMNTEIISKPKLSSSDISRKIMPVSKIRVETKKRDVACRMKLADKEIDRVMQQQQDMLDHLKQKNGNLIVSISYIHCMSQNVSLYFQIAFLDRFFTVFVILETGMNAPQRRENVLLHSDYVHCVSKKKLNPFLFLQ